MYYPKNKIKTDLYTNGDEYRTIKELTPYTGPYYSFFTGEKYTGKTPDDGPSILLVPLKEDTVPDTINTPNYKYFLNKERNPFILPYQILKSVEGNKKTYLPYGEYPTPTEDDYKIGEFQRYFLAKTVENSYIELKEEQYKKYKTKDKTVAWKYYTPFTISWQLTGTKEHVYQTNQKLTVLAEKQIKRTGLQQFLKENYLKFYKEA